MAVLWQDSGNQVGGPVYRGRHNAIYSMVAAWKAGTLPDVPVYTGSIDLSTLELEGLTGGYYTGEPLRQTSLRAFQTENGQRIEQSFREGTDYTVTYQNNGNAGIATAVFEGIGSYCGTLTVQYEILPVMAEAVTITYTQAVYEDGIRLLVPELSLTLGTEELVYGVDYEVQYTGDFASESGTGEIMFKTITQGQGRSRLRSAKISLFDVEVTMENQVYFGPEAVLPPLPVLTYKGETLVQGRDYSLEYTQDGCNGSVTITGLNGFEGILRRDFLYVPMVREGIPKD